MPGLLFTMILETELKIFTKPLLLYAALMSVYDWLKTTNPLTYVYFNKVADFKVAHLIQMTAGAALCFKHRHRRNVTSHHSFSLL